MDQNAIIEHAGVVERPLDGLNRERLTALMQDHAGVHVSLYMPTQRRSMATQQNATRCKNLLRQAQNRLRDSGLDADNIHRLLHSVESLIGDEAFWQHQNAGLAIFVSPQISQTYRLPRAFEECLVVSTHFHTKPLLPLLSGDGRFYVLALSQNAVRLLECTRDHARDVKLHDVPTHLTEIFPPGAFESQLQYHSGPQTGRGAYVPTFHGQGAARDETKTRLLTYFRHIDKGLHDLLKDERVPLVVAGVDYLLPLYREANTYAHLLKAGIEGNPDEQSAASLQERGWRIVQPIFHQAQDAAMARYKALAGTGRTANDLTEIVPAAYQGRIETLFVTLDAEQWGTFDPETNTVQMGQEVATGYADLLDVAAMQVYLAGGTVYPLITEDMPEHSIIAAIMRY